MLAKKQKAADEAIVETLLPKIEKSVLTMLQDFTEEHATGVKAEDLQQMIVVQFRKAMQEVIMPDLTRTNVKLMEMLD